MRLKKLFFSICCFIGCLLLVGCQHTVENIHALTHDYPKPSDTHTKPIEKQIRKHYHFDSFKLSIDNKFDAARLNNIEKLNDSTLMAYISPENRPINRSPWYAFRIVSQESQQIYIRLNYSEFKHRYNPKVSRDKKAWTALDTADYQKTDDGGLLMKLNLEADTLWVAAQEIVDSKDVGNWLDELAIHEDATLQKIGESREGRDLLFLNIGSGSPQGKETILVFSRQHPPEVTGYMAMQYFIEEILNNTELAREFRKKYNIMVFPLLNPDGVDLGHWRHNTGGIDLNRDWAYYRQPETKLVSDFIVREVDAHESKVILGLDFHSTYNDIYYTIEGDSISSNLPDFRKQWFGALEENIPRYKVKESSADLEKPVSKSWFYTQFNAEGITYEIGDNTPRDFIKMKGAISAREMMRILIQRKK